jgi:hypothetical protein
LTDRKLLLGKLAEGDIFHAESPGGAKLICLVTSVSETVIEARTVTTQMHFHFDRQTGVGTGKWGDVSVIASISCVAPLPEDIRDVMLGIDRKFKQEHDPNDPDRFRLNDAEIRALIYVDSHCSSNPL